MTEKVQQSVWSILKGSPVAVALLIAFWMSNSTTEKMAACQAQFAEKMAAAVDKIAQGMVEIHTHMDHLVGAGITTPRTNG